MASIISAGTTSATALNMSADTTGILQLAYNNGTIGLTINTSGNYGFATTTVATNFRAQFLGTSGSNTGPASSGTTQSASAVLRLQGGGGFTGTLDIGQGGATGSWLQSCDTTNLATAYPLILNAAGGAVCIGTTSSLGARLAIYGTSGSTDSNIQITNPGYGTGCLGVQGTSSNFKIYNCYSTGTLAGGSGIDIDTSGNCFVAGFIDAVGGLLRLGSGTTPSIYRTGANGAGFHFSTTSVLPTNASGIIADNLNSFGTSVYRWTVIYATTGSINTSDREQKQDIQDLSATELAVAKEIKAMFKTFRWKDAVAKKGDDARIHVGVIAQDVQDAFAKHGLDASRYALWCFDTWYEVDGTGVNAETGIPYTSQSEGAVERTRLGVRYDQLLAFVIAAM